MVADALSRPPEPKAATADHAATAATTMEDNPIDFQEMATEQENCAETQKLISGPTALTRILTQSHLYLIDMGNEGRARGSRPPPPHPPGDLFLTGKPDESR